mmetsp:Transcript_92494/g.220110  ORF Transcript_92494/g.220110 Transcript_92494/m.220110 type:complete len:258 (-) Transcript_92494:96-869(-)
MSQARCLAGLKHTLGRPHSHRTKFRYEKQAEISALCAHCSEALSSVPSTSDARISEGSCNSSQSRCKVLACRGSLLSDCGSRFTSSGNTFHLYTLLNSSLISAAPQRKFCRSTRARRSASGLGSGAGEPGACTGFLVVRRLAGTEPGPWNLSICSSCNARSTSSTDSGTGGAWRAFIRLFIMPSLFSRALSASTLAPALAKGSALRGEGFTVSRAARGRDLDLWTLFSPPTNTSRPRWALGPVCGSVSKVSDRFGNP